MWRKFAIDIDSNSIKIKWLINELVQHCLIFQFMRSRQNMDKNTTQIPNNPLINLFQSELVSFVSLWRLILRIEQVRIWLSRSVFLLIDQDIHFPFSFLKNKMLSSETIVVELIHYQRINRLEYIFKNA